MNQGKGESIFEGKLARVKIDRVQRFNSIVWIGLGYILDNGKVGERLTFFIPPQQGEHIVQQLQHGLLPELEIEPEDIFKRGW